jgi:beta-lactam-binding protein with PASTA domain
MKVNPMLVFVLSAVGVFVLGLLMFNYILMPLFIHHYEAVLVPDMTGMSEKQAELELNRLGFDCKIARREYTEDVPEGYVISQIPKANESVREGRTVSIVLSLGAKMQRVPDVSGLSLRQCRIVLSRNHLKIGRIAKKILTGESNETVVGTFPGPGIEVAEGATVDILITVGGKKRAFMMPDLAGQDLLFVKDKLENMGFRIGNVRYEYRQGAFPNTIIDQSPPPGSQIREGDSIELVAATTH